jgi:hypothetical protein
MADYQLRAEKLEARRIRGRKAPGFLTHRGMIMKAESWNEEKAIALLLRDGHPSPLGEGPGVRGF